MKSQYSGVGLLGILASAAIFWPLWLKSANGCAIDRNCLPLRAQLANYSYTEISVNAGESVTITCRTDCGNLNLTGCNVTDDWIAITTNAFGTIKTYNDIKHNRGPFGKDNNISAVDFSRSITQSGICNGTSTDEQFSVTVAIGDDPSFSTIIISCGLGRFGPTGYIPAIKAHDFSAVFKIHLNHPEVTTTSMVSPTVTATASPTVTSMVSPTVTATASPTVTSTVSSTVTPPIMENKIMVFSNDTDKQPLLKLPMSNNSVNVTCTKTSGAISELKVKLVDDSGRVHDPELLYTIADNRERMKNIGIDIREAGSYTEGGIVWGNFEIVLTNIQIDMVMQCGARATSDSEPVFYDHVTVTVLDFQANTAQQHQNEHPISVSLGVLLLIVIAILSVMVIIIVVRKYIGKRRNNQREHEALQRHQGIAMSDPYYNIASYPVQVLLERTVEEGQPA